MTLKDTEIEDFVKTSNEIINKIDTLDRHINELRGNFKSLDEAVRGNGKPGLNQRTAILEQKIDAHVDIDIIEKMSSLQMSLAILQSSLETIKKLLGAVGVMVLGVIGKLLFEFITR